MSHKVHVITRHQYFPDDSQMVNVHREVRQQTIGQHAHEFLEIVLVLSGEALHITGESCQRISSGHVLVVHPGRAHAYEETRGLNLINILVREEVLPRIEPHLRGLRGYHELLSLQAQRGHNYISYLQMTEPGMRQLVEWVDRLDEESRLGSSGGHLVAEAYLTLIIAEICRCDTRGRKTAAPSRERAEAGVSAALSWIEGHLHQPLLIEPLARQAGLSERGFYRAFRRQTGLTPTTYILQARVRKATELLANSRLDLSLEQIAEQCGFTDANYLTRRFKQHHGLPPRQWQKQKLQNP